MPPRPRRRRNTSPSIDRQPPRPRRRRNTSPSIDRQPPIIDLSHEVEETPSTPSDDVTITEVRIPEVSFQGISRRRRADSTRIQTEPRPFTSVVGRLVRSPAFRSLSELFALASRQRRQRTHQSTSSDDEPWADSDDRDSENSFDSDDEVDQSFEDYEMDYETEEEMNLFPSEDDDFDGDEFEDADYETYIALAEHLGEVKQRGLPSADIPHLPDRIYTQDGTCPEACVICLAEFEEGVPLVSLPCHHEFHWNCGANWLAQNASCPVCRAPVHVNGPLNPVTIT